MSSWRSRAKSLNAGSAAAPEQHPGDGASESADPLLHDKSKPSSSTVDASPSSGVSVVPEAWRPLDPLAAFESAATKQGEREQLQRRKNRKRIAWFEWLAIGAVVAILFGFGALQWRGKPLTDESDVVAEDPPHSPARGNENAGAESDRGPAPSSDSASFEERKQTAIEGVLEDAGDGSFALGGTASVENSEPLVVSSVPDSMSVAAPSPKSPTEPKPANAKTKRKFADALEPDEITTIARALTGPEPPTPSRRELVLPMRTPSSYLFKRLYKDAFDQHQVYLAAKKSDPGDHDDQLLESIQLFEQCLARPSSEVSAQQRLQIMTTLAGLYRNAGRLYDAS
ncbi:MAG: hypothetical protein AAFU85_25705, partial [Planctomycetota bacterium]